MKALFKPAAVICAVVILLCSLPISASALTIYSGDYGYEVDAFGHSVTLVDYKGSDKIVTVPDEFRNYPLKTIAASAFSGNANVEEIVIASSVTTIENEAFKGCTALKTVSVPITVTELGKGIFADCTALTSATINANIRRLPDNTFSGCSTLSSVQLRDSIVTVGTAAFAKCVSLTDLDFLANVTKLADAVFFRNSFTDIEIPGQITSIPYYAFAYSNTLTNVVINPSVTFIHENAFSGSDNVIINCYYQSYAYHYAVDNGIPYILLDAVKLGDSNGDDYVNINDVTHIQRHLAELESLSGIYLHVADANQDGTLDISDATTLQMYLAEYDIPYPIGEIMTQ